MNLLELIKAGNFQTGSEPGGYNGFGHFHKGAKRYIFGNGVELRTYTDDSFFLYIDNELISFSDWPKSLTAKGIIEAFETLRLGKLKLLG